MAVLTEYDYQYIWAKVPTRSGTSISRISVVKYSDDFSKIVAISE